MGTPNPSRVMGTPIVWERSTNKGKKRSKPRLKDADRAERSLYRAARRTADAAQSGIHRYDKARKKSDRRERDGAIIDVIPNSARGMVAAAGRLTPIPLDVMRAASPKSIRRVSRGTLRAAARVIDRS